MLDLTQNKLSREEWVSIEVPLPADEKHIVKLICNGYHDVNICQNQTLSLLAYLRIPISPGAHAHIYKRYIQDKIAVLTQKYAFGVKKPKKMKTALKKADILRLENADKKMGGDKLQLFEFVLIDALEQMHHMRFIKKEWLVHYYTLKTLLGYNIQHLNKQLVELLKDHLADITLQVNVLNLVKAAPSAIERNEKLLRYADEKLFEHQRQLFTLCKHPNPKLISCIAPTGTGKTMSPLGLSEKHRIIFVCAARHVGLALAKAAISVNKKVAFAFGCQDAADIRLHYFSAKEYIRHRKSGGIAKVDNSVGDDVEIMISDLKSYLVAMHYMLAFNKKENIVLYWDEPTITLDYEEHPLHDNIQKNWTENLIPNIILSSATLPSSEELQDTIGDFRSRFTGGEVHTIVSHDTRKTIPLLDKVGNIIMPHYISSDYAEVQQMATHCLKNYTLMRYLDLDACVKCITLINENPNWIISKRYHMEYHLSDVDSVTMTNIKLYYLTLLNNLCLDLWPIILSELHKIRPKKADFTGARLSTVDAHSLTDGPAIYLAEDVEKVAKFQLQDAKIPESIVASIMKSIQYNGVLSDKIAVLQKTLDDGLQKEEGKDKKLANGRMPPELKRLRAQIEDFNACVKSVSLSGMFVPNTRDHLERYAPGDLPMHHNAFTSNISEHIVEKIMLIDDVNNEWKLLLLMGIGVFASHKSAKYTEVMKTLAQEQKLYLIIASSDYIYGTNYQFCHGYLGKDLSYMSQEKCIQAMGRVGRKSFQKKYSLRLRDVGFAKKLFYPHDNKPEVKNMARLFTTPLII